jgi:hypothetical protein
VQEITQFINSFGQVPQAQTQNTAGMQSQQTAAVIQQKQNEKPVISAMGGNAGKSPIRKVVSSIDDLKKIRQGLTT